MNLATWNVRGLNKRPHQNEVVNFISSNSLSLICCVETKVKENNFLAISKRINRNWSWVHNYDCHHNGRIWVGWDKNIWKLAVHSKTAQQITCSLTFLEKDIQFFSTFVYALNKPHQREPLWHNLISLSKLITGPWLISGDFNCILSLLEVKGGKEHWTPDMQSFKDCISDSGLGHVNTTGPLHTWYNNRPNNIIRKRLDRVLGNKDWFSQFTNSFVTVKNRGILDHCPLLLTVPMQLDKIVKPFQYFHFMSTIPEFQEVVRKAWTQSSWYGDPLAILARKLKDTKKALAVLNKAHGNVHTNVTTARENLADIQNSLSDTTDPIILQHEQTAIRLLEQALLEEESLLLQKSRVKWLSAGDNNTSFFFNQVKANWNCNKIMSIQDSSGTMVSGHKSVSQVAVDYFTSTLGTCQTVSPCNLQHLNCPILSEAQQASLLAPITDDLILNTLKAMKKNKAPGPDGFSAEFFLAVWPIIQQDFCSAVKHFFATSNMHKGLNSTSIALIPKVPTPTVIQDFRPISLCTTVYKCVTKIIADRIKIVIPFIIDPAQSAFIPGRGISDNILLAQEIFRGYSRTTGVAKCGIKVDLQKAFDSLDWNFLISALQKLQFPGQFCNWIFSCISTASYSVKINGALSGYFNGKRGLRQGDPLSPYLFSIALNMLSSLLNNAPQD